LETIATALESVKRRIAAAEAASGRPSGGVALLAVSKTHGPEVLRAAYAAGQRAFGENYLQEGLAKVAALAVATLALGITYWLLRERDDRSRSADGPDGAA